MHDNKDTQITLLKPIFIAFEMNNYNDVINSTVCGTYNSQNENIKYWETDKCNKSITPNPSNVSNLNVNCACMVL